MIHAVLLNTLPVELCHLAAESSSSPRPYDDLCAAVLACYGQTYRPLPGSREFQISPPSQGAATSASIPAPDHPPDEVQEVPAAIGHSTESSVFSTASARGPSDVPAICTSSPISMAHDSSATSGSTTATSPHALESTIDRDIVKPAIRSPIAEASPAMMSDEPVFPSTSTLCAPCQQQPASPSQSLAAEVPAPNHRWPNFLDAATMTDAPEDDVPGQHTPELTAYATPATEADIQHADLRTSAREPTTVGASTSTGSPSEPAAETTPAQLHHRFPAEPLTQDTIHPTNDRYAGALVTTATTPNRPTCLQHATLRRQSHRARRQTRQKLHTRPSTLPRGAAISLKGIYALRRHLFVRRHVTDTHWRRRAPRHMTQWSTLRRRLRRHLHSPSTASAGTSLSRAHSRQPVRYRKAPSSRRGTHLGTSTAYFRPILRPLRFSQSCPPETYRFPKVLARSRPGLLTVPLVSR
ncbi:hypothetical protein HPB52_013519 [Rhipicephalus sanguineus]|uniref:Uncharacterized protein n=1 Tax=Rhipicephalus sanguineus TaxID=34632 RepID=A0A9D4PGN5_RHISA|nr:hypothetical protein HPB52_013519 [Rhipicephalus sanguineus]